MSSIFFPPFSIIPHQGAGDWHCLLFTSYPPSRCVSGSQPKQKRATTIISLCHSEVIIWWLWKSACSYHIFDIFIWPLWLVQINIAADMTLVNYAMAQISSPQIHTGTNGSGCLISILQLFLTNFIELHESNVSIMKCPTPQTAFPLRMAM